MTAPLLQPLAHFVSTFGLEGHRPSLDARLFTTMSDWSSALLSGLGHPLCVRYLAALAPFAQESGPASIAGRPQGYPVATAAAANAAISHLWEVDDAHRDSTTHPGITVIPAVFALAQAFPATSPERIRTAIVVGYEAVLRVGSFLGSRHYAICHTTATAGTFGAAAAAAHLLGLDTERTLWTFGHAGTQAQGLWQILDDDASEAKGFHPAIAVRNGIGAAMMANAGLKGAPHILEGPRGMLAAWGLTDCDPAWLLPTGELMIETTTVKNWPTCGQMHSALDCAAELIEAGTLFSDQIVSVTVDVPRACADIASVEAPKSVSAAKFSTSFCVAAMLSGSRPDFRGLTPALVDNKRIQELAERVTLRIEPDFSARFPQERPARVTVHLADGSSRSVERAFRKGDPEAPWTREEMIERTRDILALSGREADAGALIDWCDRFTTAPVSVWSVDELFALATPRILSLEARS